MTVLYFAYGSNMLTRRLRDPARAPSARVLATGYVPGRRLVFDKAGQDGSGKCDIEVSDENDRVYGVLYALTPRDMRRLDRVEGLGFGYRRDTLEVFSEGRSRPAATYLALEKTPGLMPFDWYKQLVVAGADEHGLPEAYLERLRAEPARGDPDSCRVGRAAQLLCTGEDAEALDRS